jgi:hypothetical protein
VSEAIADESVQTHAFLGGGTNQFPVKRLWNTDVELARP